jgi:phosphoenolpyruvate-protein phosphotransferase
MREIRGIAAAPGIAIGPLFKYSAGDIAPEEHPVGDTTAEWRRLADALDRAGEQLQAVHDKAAREAGAKTAEIFDAQAAMLQDPELLDLCRKELEIRQVNIEVVWQSSSEHFAKKLEALGNDYLRARAADVRDVAHRVLRLLAGDAIQGPLGPTEPSIIVASDLTPSDTIMLDKAMVLGFCTEAGGETSHTAILSRGLGLPAIVGVGPELMALQAGSRAILDGTAGLLLIDPEPAALAQWENRKSTHDGLYASALELCREPAVTLDGKQVEVVANIGSLSGGRAAIENGAEGVGLLRTEFLYLERSTLPDEAEQLEAYRAILDVFDMRPVVLRTIDIGGDKAIPYLNLPIESNPFLGVRGLRLCLARPELFKPQLRAALQASVGHNLKIMFPMVATLEEVQVARKLVDDCLAELAREGKPVAEKIEIGVMVEIPSAAVLAEQIAPAVDFFSIGTNDLTQYTMAADRTNAQLSHLASAFSPAVLRLINWVIEAGHRHGKWVGVCGELAGEPLAIPILLGLGLDEFSMNPPAIPLAKQILRRLTTLQCKELAEQALLLGNPQQVKNLVVDRLPWINS